ncbi:hypothetical protein B0H21DRAFT_310324 [Amylocystis lapponica]|nr:hypothetical protein B0H21DRAFT_310324 [Amylocystis lapponica]
MAAGSKRASSGGNNGKNKSPAKARATKRARKPSADLDAESEQEVEVSDGDAVNDDGEADDDEDDEASLHSDALDDDTDVEDAKRKANKRKRASGSLSPVKGKQTSKRGLRQKRRKVQEESDEEVNVELKEGQEVAGIVVQAPKTGRVPPGQISQNTLNFLSQMKNPEYNDREWFKLHEPVYRLAEKEWKDFISAFTDLLVEADPQIPHLPPKDVIHRVYRDVRMHHTCWPEMCPIAIQIRFSNDKTPYKTNFSASFSRSGRKGLFAHYHIPGHSMFAAGSWCPGKNELSTLRNNIKRSSTRLRSILSAPAFVRLFGEAKPHPQGEQQSIFGREDELKTAPKGVDKNHKDIDLLKCRTFAVACRFTDGEVLAPDFKENLCKMVKIAQPFVHCLNDMMTLQDAGGSDDEDEDEEEGASGSEAH